MYIYALLHYDIRDRNPFRRRNVAGPGRKGDTRRRGPSVIFVAFQETGGGRYDNLNNNNNMVVIVLCCYIYTHSTLAARIRRRASGDGGEGVDVTARRRKDSRPIGARWR